MANFKIEAYSYDLLKYGFINLPGVHDFWVLSNADTGEVIAELQGMATAREDVTINGVFYARGETVPIGTDPKLFSLQIHQFVHDPNFMQQFGVTESYSKGSGEFQAATDKHTVFTGSSEEALARWGAAVNAIPLLNGLNLDYPKYGIFALNPVNSNSVYQTLGEIMGIGFYDFPWSAEPGLGNLMLGPLQIEFLKYKPFPSSSLLDWGSIFNAADAEGALYTYFQNDLVNTDYWYDFNTSYWRDFTATNTNWLLTSDVASTYYSPYTFDYSSVIGAFYEAVNPAADNALSIAHKTPVILGGNNLGLTAAQLAARDTNADGQLSGSELTDLNLWADLNENGHLDSGELSATTNPIKSADYAFYTRGNGQPGPGVAATPVVNQTAPTLATPASNYRSLRDTDNIYFAYGVYIFWSANQIKINYNNKSYLVGTDGNDNFNANYYAADPQYFNNSLLTNFLGGGGDDLMGGSSRSDNLWGGTGNDTLFGYDGDDALYGEEGDDIAYGDAGNDRLAGGIGNDILLGDAGNDIVVGGDGADQLEGNEGNEPVEKPVLEGFAE